MKVYCKECEWVGPQQELDIRWGSTKFRIPDIDLCPECHSENLVDIPLECECIIEDYKDLLSTLPYYSGSDARLKEKFKMILIISKRHPEIAPIEIKKILEEIYE